MTASTKISGAWKDVSAISTKVSGAWKDVSEGYTKISGAWQQFFAPAAAGSFDLLETEILTGSETSVSFTSLNTAYGSTYQHLQLRMTGRTDRASSSDFIEVQFNGDTGSNYAHHSMYGAGSGVIAGTPGTSDSKMDFNRLAGATASANVFGAIIMDILDPFESTKYTTVRTLGGVSSVSINLNSGLWMNTNSITSIEIYPGSGSNLLTGSRFSLYGWKVA